MKLAVISDIHSDFPSLEKALDRIRTEECDRILCLGDIVGYSYHYADWLDGRDPNACVEMVRQHCDDVICGNHDLNAVKKLPSNHALLGMPEDWYEIDMGTRNELAGGRLWLYDDEIEDPLNAEATEYLAGLEEQILIRDDRFNILATHFVYPDITGNQKGSPTKHEDFKDHIRLLRKNRCLVGLAGHAHLEGYAQISKKAFGMNYFREAELIRRPQLIVVPAITRSKGRNGYLILDTEKFKFEAVPLD